MKSLTYTTLSVFFLTIFWSPQWNTSSKAFMPIEESTVLVCPNPCQTTDSLALIAIYNAALGPGWTNLWDTSLPVCTPWDGVELDDDGFVTRLTLNNNNLIGFLPPEVGDFVRIEELQLDNNALSGIIPPQIGNLGSLEICFLDNNNFTGTIPDEFGNLSMMHTLYLDNNQLVGAIPNTFLNLNNLFKFDIFNNNLDSIPDLSSTNLQPNKFRIYNNEFTFDDIVLNDLTALGTFYTPQDSVNQPTTENLLTGDDYILDLDFDNGITDNIYQWYKDGVIFGAPSNSNKLSFSPVTWATAGEYRCQVTNPNASLLTLHTRPVTINVSCGVSTFSLNDTLCHGGSIEFNSVIYDASNPTGFFPLPGQDQYGCDSLIVIDLSFRSENIFELNETICIDDTIIVNNVVYNQANPSGTEILSDQYSCDSIVEVNLTFYTAAAAGNLSPIICRGDSIELFGVFYDEDQPTGTIVLDNATATSCDSTIFIEVQFYPQAIGTFSPTICEGGSITVGGQPFDESAPTGQVNLGPISQNGCDSFLNVNLSFFSAAEGTYEDVLCFGDSVVINNTVYNQANPTGTELYPNASSNLCDSVLFVNLTFDSNITELLNPTICQNDFILVNGVTYDEGNPSGNEMIAGGSSNGCDSIVVIDLSFHPDPIGVFENTLCSGDSVIINGTTYNETNPSGTEILTAASITTGCDSIVNINLSFSPPIIHNINQTLCPGDSIIVNGITYNESNPSGTELLALGSNTGCDSTILVDLDFLSEIISTFDPTVCLDASFEINSTTYDFSNPNGTEIITTGSGCDSTININLSFFPDNPGFITDTLCTEQGIFINGTPYNESNPSGTEILTGESSNGCDSTVIINLTFIQISEGLLNPTLCPGDSVVINGVVYNEGNPTGIQFFENEAISGCDSSVVIDLNYYEDIPGNYTSTLCPGDSVVFNGVTYNESNLTGTEVLQGASINGCDSTLIINLDYFPSALNVIDDVLCQHDELIINNQTYDINNQNGTEVIPNGSINGCDSTIIIDLTFNLEVNITFNQALCSGDSIIVNNIVYNEGNPSGTETFNGAAASGCDSIINIDLSFHPIAFEMITETLCDSDSIIVNGTTYNTSNSTGTELIENGSLNGCDSIIDINLTFHPQAMGFFNPSICQGDTFEYNGQNFSAANPNDIVVLENASVNGCDSIVDFQLSFYDLPESDFSTTICTGDSLFFNGSIFHATNPDGLVTLENASATGCDSTITVQVSFHDVVQSDFTPTLCTGDTLIFQSISYHANNSNGQVIFENASTNGCDSIVNIQLNFFDPIVSEINESICEGSDYEIAGQVFSESGTFEVILENASTMGCDSTILLQLEVLNASALGLANAGDDVFQCENILSLNANLPNNSTGQWQSMEGHIIENPDQANLDLNNLNPGNHHFVWTLSSGQCINYDSDTIQVYIQESPDAIDDQYVLDIETSSLDLDFLQNDNLSNNEAWTFNLLDSPSMGTLDELEEGVFQFNRNSPLGGDLLLQYEICDEDCPELCDSAFVEISLAFQSIENLDIPNAITPNGDGINETFMFPHLEFEPDKYPDKEMIIFNRWGDIVYEAHPYLNDWNGVDKNGNALPQGTYYYVLRLDIATGIILKGDVSILK